MKKNALLFALACYCLLNFGCNKCDDIACFSPPTEFVFRLLDKDSGEDLVANGTFSTEDISIVSLADEKSHELSFSSDEGEFIIIDQEIGWNTGAEKANYELRLNETTTLPFTYETKEVSRDCCTFFELVKFEINGADGVLSNQQNLYLLKI